MPSTVDHNLLPEFDSIRDLDEMIYWTGRPKFIPFIFSGFLEGVFAIGFAAIWFTVASKMTIKSGIEPTWQVWIGLFPVAVFVLRLLNRLVSFGRTCYAYSNKRVMIRGGLFGASFKIIDYDKISDMEVTVNMIERASNVGTIKFFSGRTKVDEGDTTKLYDKWEGIPDPYGIFKQVKQEMGRKHPGT